MVPTILEQLLADDNLAKRTAVSKAMFKMKKLNIKELQTAYDEA